MQLILCGWLVAALISAVSCAILLPVAGTGTATFGGDAGPAAAASLNRPSGVFVEGESIYFTDNFNHRVRKILPDGSIITVVGNGTACSTPSTGCGDGGPLSSVMLNEPYGIFVEDSGDIYIADARSYRIRKFSGSTVTTVAGNGLICGSSQQSCGDNGPALSARLMSPTGVTVDTQHNIYIADQIILRVRKVLATDGTIITIAGNGSIGETNPSGLALSALLREPVGIWMDAANHIFIAERLSGAIRKIFPENGTIITIASGLGLLTGVSVDGDGNIFAADRSSSRILKILPDGQVSRIAGNGTACASPTSGCGVGSLAFDAQLNQPRSVFVTSSGRTVFIADTLNHRIWKVEFECVGKLFGNQCRVSCSDSYCVF